jgi:hypothetical protein
MLQIKLWSLDKNENDQLVPNLVQTVDKTETENQLESILVNNPNILLPGLKLIGRQTPTEGGPLDLLGVDEDGNLIVFELKRGTLSREAVAQIIDYASFLASLDRETLCKHIADRSGNGGIEKITDFESWFQEQFSGSLDALDNPPKMVLVGLGADDRTKRMVSYLSQKGVDISLITFYAFKKGEQVFLAKQVEIELADNVDTQKQVYTKASNLETLQKLAAKINVTNILEKVSGLIRNEMVSSYEWPNKTGCSFSLIEKTDEGKPSYRVYASIYLNESRHGAVQLAFQPRAVEAAIEAFELIRDKYKDFKLDKYNILSIWLKDNKHWEEFSIDLKTLINEIVKGWRKKQTTNEISDIV